MYHQSEMSFTADQIEEIVDKLIKLKETHSAEQINALEEYNDFKLKNRVFYEMILSNEGLNQVIFKEMMKMKRRLESGEDQYSVDVKFGQFMASKYIDPVAHTFKKKET
jgi:hypothetical protein